MAQKLNLTFMRKLVNGLLILSALAFIQSCQKEVDFEEESAVTGDFKAKIEGTQWVANKAAGGYRINNLISINGISNDRKYLTIVIGDSGVHNYTLDENSITNAASYIDSTLPNPMNFTTNQGLSPGDAGGTVNITEINTSTKKISGTFSFKVFRQLDGLQRTFTEGSFTNISYSTTLPPTNSSDTFKVKIAGNLWVPPTAIGSLTPAVPPLLPAKIAISGTDATGSKAVGLFMPADITPGTYTLDWLAGTYIGQYNPDTDPNHSQGSTSGTLTIISHNTTGRRIRGTFNFHGETILPPIISTELTEGYFNMKY